MVPFPKEIYYVGEYQPPITFNINTVLKCICFVMVVCKGLLVFRLFMNLYPKVAISCSAVK